MASAQPPRPSQASQPQQPSQAPQAQQPPQAQPSHQAPQPPQSLQQRTTIRTHTRVEVSSDRGVFMISVAAELAGMHPQTLRMYETRGLIEPKRSPKGTRLYSHADVQRLKRIQEMTVELGLNLAGVERVFELENMLDGMSRKVQALERRAAELKAEVERLEALRRELRAEIVPYVRGGALIRASDFS